MPDDMEFPDFQGDYPKPPRRPPRPKSFSATQGLPQISGRKLALIGAPVILVLLFLLAFVTGRGGIVEVSDTEVAVIVNYVNGNKKLETTPGYKIFLPVVQQAFKFDKSPNKFLMEGDRNLNDNHVKKLTVRAKDGSNFWFETLEIQYQLLEGEASLVLEDSGPGQAFKRNWIRAYARSILRDEFGRFSSEEVADQSNYTGATAVVKDRLNQLLEPHGITVIQIIVPKPKFDPLYEQAIKDRKVADQEVEKLKTKATALLRERERRLADIDRDKATAYEQLLGELEAERIMSERERVRVERSADAFKIEMVAAGQAEEQRMLQQARAKEEQARKEAEGLRARVDALAKRGDVLVREILAEKLASIRFNIVPYRRDPSPVRIEHLSSKPEGGQP
ncbi:MAG: hypothetical protein DWQ01_13465 [Planctomycetota bacterium]|nr:MAG: hypothetical protein DWQ01_13465 [Planctomycetota bacterium]